jgi:lipid II:glycine glycyltransferase (peptidoglycan interpeptide bridge formation enzyme)
METFWRSALDEGEARELRAFLERAPDAHFSQDPAFARIAVAGKRRAAQFFLARERGALVGAAVVLRPRAIGPILAPLASIERGPVCADPSMLARVLPALAKHARRRGIARLAVMPYWAGEAVTHAARALEAAGFRDVQAPDGSHVCTLRFDIRGKTDDQILAGNERKKLRYELRNAERAGVVVRRGGRADFATFETLDRDLASAQGRGVRGVAWFDAVASYLVEDERRGALFVAEHEERPLAAVLALRQGRGAVFYAGASTVAPRPFSKMASPLFAAVRWARDAGCETFDLGGVPMEGDRDPKRASIAQFKRDFAKTPVSLVHEHARWF